MEHRKLGRSGLEVSRICLGAMNFGTPGWGCDRDAAAAIVAVYRDAGGSVFDTADVYGAGASEQILGDLLRGARDEVVVATKVGLSLTPGPNRAGTSAKHIRTSVEASLRRLGTDYIDLYQLHNYDTAVPLEESLTAMDDLVRAGKVRYVGCSNYFAWQIAEAMGTAASRGLTGLVSAQMMYNLIRHRT
jgi:1-deoxyxylulose-5-phosphate synthase